MLEELRGVFLQYRFIYNYVRNKAFRVSKVEHFFRVGWETGNIDTFYWPI